MFFIRWVLMITDCPLKGWWKKRLAKRLGFMRRRMVADHLFVSVKKLLMMRKWSLRICSTPLPYQLIGIRNIKPSRLNRSKFLKPVLWIYSIRAWLREDSPQCFGIVWIEQHCHRRIWWIRKCQA